MAAVNYRILPFAGGWGLLTDAAVLGPYFSVELACQVAIATLRLRPAGGKSPRLMFEDAAGTVTVLWPKDNMPVNAALYARAPWAKSYAGLSLCN